MRNRGVRIGLVALVVLVLAGAAWQVWVGERERASREIAARKFEVDARSLRAGMANLRTAQQAYVADGQDAAAWFGKATAAVDALNATLAETRGVAANPDAVRSLDAAADLLATLSKTDAQARTLITSDQRLMASDLIYGDAAETIAAWTGRVDEAVTRETDDLARRFERIRMTQAAVAGAAGGVSLIGLLLLLPGGSPSRTSEPLSITGMSTATQTPPPMPPAPPAPDLGRVAALCVEFSRVGDPGALPRLVERAASVLNASGVIVWMANPATGALHAVLSHGYSELALARIGDLASSEDNATAEAFRTGALRVVEASGGANGAIAVPLVTPAGCVGVMAAEIRDGGEKRAASQAIATIVAAQLASLASASPAAQ